MTSPVEGKRITDMSTNRKKLDNNGININVIFSFNGLDNFECYFGKNFVNLMCNCKSKIILTNFVHNV